MFNIGDIHEEDILNIIVIVDVFPEASWYETRGLAGRWLVFWAILEVKEERRKEIIEMFWECGFMVRRRDKMIK